MPVKLIPVSEKAPDRYPDPIEAWYISKECIYQITVLNLNMFWVDQDDRMSELL